MLKDLSVNMLAMLVIYLFSLIYGLNFVVSSISFGIGSLYPLQMLLMFLIVLLPALFFALYFLRSHIELLYGKERTFRILSYVFTIISVVFVAIFIIPISY